jgi:hypothetical protein
MRERYISAFKKINTTGDVLIYSSVGDSIVHSLFICNLTSNMRHVTLTFKDGDSTVSLFNNLSLPASTTYSLEKTINLKNLDELYVSCDIANALDVSVGILKLVPLVDEVYTNAYARLTSTPIKIYEAPSLTTSSIHSFYVTNIDESLTSNVNLWIVDEFQSSFYLMKNTEIEFFSVIWNKPINLLPGQSLYGSVEDNDNQSDVFLSILELTG